MFKIFLSYIFIILSFFIISCGESNKTSNNCKTTEVLLDDKCVDKALLCNNILCKSDELCLDNACVNETLLCNNILCESDELCQNDLCVNKSLVCDTECAPNETCHNNICKKSLLVSTYNLYDLKNDSAYENLAKFIQESNIDIMLVQEIQVEDKDSLVEELNKLGLELHIEFSSYGGYGGDEGDDYLAVISKWPLEEVNTILSQGYEDPITGNFFYFSYLRPVLEIKLKVFEEDITIFNIHLKAQSPWATCFDCIEKRRAQASALEDYINYNLDAANDNIIIAGDANTATETGEDFEEGNTLDILSLKSDNPEVTENDFIPVNYIYKKEKTHTRYDSIMDHIILSPSLFTKYRTDSVDIVTPEGKPSDHKAVLLILDF